MQLYIGVRANIHLGGGRPSFARMDSVGVAEMVVAEIFRDPNSVGGGVVAEIFRARFGGSGRILSVNSSNIPSIRVIQNVLCFARII